MTLKWKWYIFIQENPFESIVWKMGAILSRPQCVKSLADWPGWWLSFNDGLSAWPPCAHRGQMLSMVISERCKHCTHCLRFMISFIEWLASVTCVLSFFQLIQLEFLYDMLKGVFLIGTTFWSDMMGRCSVVDLSLSQNMRFYKEQTRSQPMFSPPPVAVPGWVDERMQMIFIIFFKTSQ